jgi:hypothetical protein
VSVPGLRHVADVFSMAPRDAHSAVGGLARVFFKQWEFERRWADAGGATYGQAMPREVDGVLQVGAPWTYEPDWTLGIPYVSNPVFDEVGTLISFDYSGVPLDSRIVPLETIQGEASCWLIRMGNPGLQDIYFMDTETAAIDVFDLSRFHESRRTWFTPVVLTGERLDEHVPVRLQVSLVDDRGPSFVAQVQLGGRNAFRLLHDQIMVAIAEPRDPDRTAYAFTAPLARDYYRPD